MVGTEVTRVLATRTQREGRSYFFFLFVIAILNATPPTHRDHPGGEDNHPADGGGPPAIDLGPAAEPESTGGGASPKPDAHDPGEPEPPQPKDDIIPNVGNGENKSADATAQAKPGPDPMAGKSPPDIPVFLGPSNSSPPPGSSSPPSDAPQYSGNPGDEDTSCGGGPFGESLVNLLSNNGGDGGDASSGKATRQERTPLLVQVSNSNTFQSFGDGGSGSNSAYSGAGGDASGGSVNAYPALINILSNNGGDGGDAKSGDSIR